MSMTDNELRAYLARLDWQMRLKNYSRYYNNPEMTHEEARMLLGIKRETVTRWIRGIDKKEEAGV